MLSNPDVTIPDDLHLFTEDWEEAPAVPASPPHRHRCAVVFLSDPGRQDEVRRRLTADHPDLTVVCAARGTAYRRLAADRYEVGGDLAEAYRALLRAVTDDHGPIDVVAHLWATEHREGQDLLRDPDPLRDLLRIIAREGGPEGRAPGRIVLGGTFTDDLERCALESWLGFERSVGLVVPGTSLTVLCLDGTTPHAPELPDVLAGELRAEEPVGALHTGGRRYVQRVRPATLQPSSPEPDPLRHGGTYLITGGAGGLGTVFATWLARAYQARLVLLGRRPADAAAVRERLAALEAAGAGGTLYCQADVCDAAALTAAVGTAAARFGRIDGVFHAAGVEQHGSIANRDAVTFARVLGPKVAGTVNLENALAQALTGPGRAPDFVCYFSSSAAVLGDFGSCDYAVGNRFQVGYARHLAQRDPAGPKRLAISWPMWRSDGMNFADADTADFYLRSSGQRYLEPAEGTGLFRRLVTQPDASYLVLAGQGERIRAALRAAPGRPTRPRPEPRPGTATADPAQELRRELNDIVSQILRLPVDKLASDENLRDFGFDSITLVEFAGVLSERLEVDFTPDLFFSYPTLHTLHEFLLGRHHTHLADRYRAPSATAPPEAPAPDRRPAPAHARRGARLRTRREDASRFATARPRPDRRDTPPTPASSDERFAIIGMSGRFPAAHTVEELWALLAEGRSAIGPVPRERHEWWADGKERRIGWLPGIAEFDPLFFEIAPSEAATMDPRQRLLLEEMWKALEDAGCAREQLATEKVGVFVGVEEGDYRLLAATEEGITSNHNAVLAARLSYFLNLTGPGIAINTACSSGLVALHEACLSLRHGDCDTAIVASANLMATPREFDAMVGAGMLSPQGVCRAFDRRADGMVPGEAVAAIVLKRRGRAERDGHRVYADILATGINNDGRTNGITAPSGHAQTRLLQEVYQRAGISPDSLGHLVTHGTGTRLGDPVEINALAEAFRPHTARTGFCALTSTKPNVGHALAASGLVSLIGLVLGMRHETIPPSINCEEISDFVNWADSPFYVNHQPRPWPEDGGLPRRGAVSAFGFSGTNAHVVVESRDTARGDLARLGAQPAPPWHLLVCSARTEAALTRQLRRLADHLAALPGDAGPGLMASVSHTLIAGRHHFARRCAVVVRDREQAVAALLRAADGQDGPEVVRGTVPREYPLDAAGTRALRELVAEAADGQERELLTELARSYCRGHEPAAFAGLWGDTPPERMSLPPYAFDNAEYWVSAGGADAAARLHPLVHRNVSDVTCQRFASTFTGRENWFGRSAGGVMAPGALLELARAAVVLGLGLGGRAVALHDVRWHEPVTLADQGRAPDLDLHIDLRQAGDGTVDWAVYVDEGDGDSYLACDGGAAPVPPSTEAGRPDALDLPALRAEAGPGRLLLELDPVPDEAPGDELVLRPEQLDACLAVVRGHLGWGEEGGEVTAVAEAGFAAPAQPARWALVTSPEDGAAGTRSLTVELAAADGTVVARLREPVLSREWARPRPEPATDRAPGEGRRPRMRGWTVPQCLAWELADAAGQVLGLPAEELDAEENLANYGIDSLNIAKFATQLSGRLGLTVTPDLFFSHPTLKRLETHLLTAHAERMDARYRAGSAAPSAPPAAVRERKRRSDRFADGAPGRPAGPAVGAPDEPIAIVGMSGRFPDARTVAELWSILSEGRSVVREVPEERRPWWNGGDRAGSRQLHKFGCVPGIAEFDPLFFEISPREAELMDPRQRLLLQEMWRALEDAGYGHRTVTEENVGIFVGVEEGDYRYLVDQEATVTSNSTSILASRLAYFLNLSGPSMAINTSCSSGLVALHEACLSLRYGDCDTAIVAGAGLMASDHDCAAMEKANMLSPDRTCYAFDRRANGLVPGEAVAVLVLKKQRAAERDGHPVHATILGSGVNYDGRTNGITAPSGEAQSRLLSSVYDRHGISPDTLDYVVAHGTGTRLGDPIETNALVEAFRSRTDRTGFCALTSVKPNIGHTMAASGLVNLICLVTAMEQKTIPPSINCRELSDYIEWEKSPFFVNREALPWPATPGRPRRGAVSSFGMSGTNAHVVLQAYGAEREDEERPTGRATPSHHLLLVSAKTEEALTELLNGLADHLADHPTARPAGDAGARFLASVSRTLMTGRHHFAHRCAVVVEDGDDAVRMLREAAAGAKIPNLVRGTVSRDFTPNATIGKLIEGLVRAGRTVRHDAVTYPDHLTALAEFYCQGYPPEFEDLWDSRPRLVGLPGYPFAAEHYWAPADPRRAPALAHAHTSDRNVIHRFSSQFTGREAFLNDLLIPIENTTR
ncbi:SDR family NAD(P)-dependent oxidoreductase [Streptomyces sp. LZ34]